MLCNVNQSPLPVGLLDSASKEGVARVGTSRAQAKSSQGGSVTLWQRSGQRRVTCSKAKRSGSSYDETTNSRKATGWIDGRIFGLEIEIYGDIQQ